jgi:anti-sigma regulatory factor (Ser/Thr protein kinase)
MTVDVELDSTPEAVAWARQALDGLEGGVPPRRMRDVRLLVSELVTNAVRHAGLGRDDRIRLRASLDSRILRVEVHDPGMGFTPKTLAPDPTRTSGWGLYLVEELADRWGVEGADPGSQVWFELDAVEA